LFSVDSKDWSAEHIAANDGEQCGWRAREWRIAAKSKCVNCNVTWNFIAILLFSNRGDVMKLVAVGGSNRINSTRETF